ncbi:hypothetical protein MASR2M78_17860 [Treponema sp.]
MVKEEPWIRPLLGDLEKVAEMERSEGFVPGLALTASRLHEARGELGLAAIAAFKELRWAYALSPSPNALITEDIQRERLRALRAQYQSKKDSETFRLLGTVDAILAFIDGRWKEAEAALSPVLAEDEEPDSFGHWMQLVCTLQQDYEKRSARNAYAAIRSRYQSFPEYWLYLAEFQNESLAMEAAERCVSLSPAGPWASRGRRRMALLAGLKAEDGGAILSRTEIEKHLTKLLAPNPELSDELKSLLSLDDNPYTLYALGALRSASEINELHTLLVEESEKARGTLASRLRYAALR